MYSNIPRNIGYIILFNGCFLGQVAGLKVDEDCNVMTINTAPHGGELRAPLLKMLLPKAEVLIEYRDVSCRSLSLSQI